MTLIVMSVGGFDACDLSEALRVAARGETSGRQHCSVLDNAVSIALPAPPDQRGGSIITRVREAGEGEQSARFDPP
jgi:hypothetical protein